MNELVEYWPACLYEIALSRFVWWMGRLALQYIVAYLFILTDLHATQRQFNLVIVRTRQYGWMYESYLNR